MFGLYQERQKLALGFLDPGVETAVGVQIAQAVFHFNLLQSLDASARSGAAARMTGKDSNRAAVRGQLFDVEQSQAMGGKNPLDGQ